MKVAAFVPLSLFLHCRFEVSIAYYIRSCRWLVLACEISLVLILSDCQSPNKRQLGTWQTYHNQRYGFEFLYPSNWVPAPIPSNRDGQAFSGPLPTDVEIRGSAGYIWQGIEAVRCKCGCRYHHHPKVSKQNFTTQQGLTGELKVEVDSEFSSMTLTLKQRQILYVWQGQAPSKQFADYYRFFYYVASQYRVPLRN